MTLSLPPASGSQPRSRASGGGRAHRQTDAAAPAGESGRRGAVPGRRWRRVVVALAAATTVALTGCGGGGSADDEPGAFASVPGATPDPDALAGSDAGGDGEGGAAAPVGAGGEAPVPPPGGVACPAEGGVLVRTAEQLEAALSAASPGSVIRLADGVFVGDFELTRSGTESAPIWLCGSRNAVIDGDGDAKYLLHLNNVSWVRVVGFALRDGRKGVMADSIDHTIIASLHVSQIGDEAIHLRSHSTDNLVIGNVIRDTGNRREKFGEGVYIGSATSNWCEYTNCEPDRSNRNAIIDNDIAGTTSEGIDVKEGTEGGVIRGNTLSGDGLVEADSWIDLKGNGWLVEGNTGTGGGSIKDGIQTHVIEEGWGRENIIRGNILDVRGEGYGIFIHEGERTDNIVGCDNQVTAAGKGFSNVDCSDA